MTLADELRVEDGVAQIPEAWSKPWTFGGFSAALALSAMAGVSSHPELLSTEVSFLGPLVAGPARVEASVVREGGSFAGARATITQDDEPALMASAWFAPSGTLPAAEADPEPTGETRSLQWYQDAYPFFHAYEMLGVDYPVDLDTETEDPPPPRTELWIRGAERLAIRTALERQILAVMVLDAQLLAPSVRQYGWATTWATSHVLSVHFIGLPGDGWWRARCEAHPGQPHTVGRGEVVSAAGPCAWGVSNGRVRAGK